MGAKSSTDKKDTRVIQEKRPKNKKSHSQAKIKTALKAGPDSWWP